MNWRDWHNWRVIRTTTILAGHALDVGFCAVLFKLVVFVVHWAVRDQSWLGIVDKIEGFVLVGLLLWFTYQMGVLLWNERVRISGDAKVGILVLA